jgi:hypothetical protein
MFAGKAGSYPIEAPRLERLAKNKHSSYYKNPKITAVTSFKVQAQAQIILIRRY